MALPVWSAVKWEWWVGNRMGQPCNATMPATRMYLCGWRIEADGSWNWGIDLEGIMETSSLGTIYVIHVLFQWTSDISFRASGWYKGPVLSANLSFVVSFPVMSFQLFIQKHHQSKCGFELLTLQGRFTGLYPPSLLSISQASRKFFDICQEIPDCPEWGATMS